MINVEDHLKLASVAASRIYKTTTIRYRFEYDDVYQQCCLELARCANKFDSSKGAFSTYAIRCMELACYRMMRDDRFYPQSRIKKETWGNSFSSLDCKIGEDEHVDMYNLTQVNDDYTILFVEEFIRTLKEDEKEVLALLLQGYTIQEIADKKNKVHSVINKKIKRIGSKLQGKYHDKRTDRKGKISKEILERNTLMLELYNNGYSQKEIGQKFGISQMTVCYAIRQVRKLISV